MKESPSSTDITALSESVEARSRQLVRAGWALTTVVLAAAGLIVWSGHPNVWSMAPNEWGDLIAGFSGALAFVWLVVGYYRQGLEIRLNTTALSAQVGEMRQAAEHQKSAAESSKLSADALRSAYRLDTRLRLYELQPKFDFQNDFGIAYAVTVEADDLHGSFVELKFLFKNVGHPCTQLSVLGDECTLQTVGTVFQGADFEFFLNEDLVKQSDTRENYPIIFKYTDILGTTQIQKFQLKWARSPGNIRGFTIELEHNAPTIPDSWSA